MREERAIPKTINQEAAEWFARRDSGEMTAADEARLAAWLESDPGHVRAFERAQAIWRSLEVPMVAAPTPLRRRLRRSRWSRTDRRRRWLGGAIAASLVFSLFVGSDIFVRLQADAITATGEIRTVGLPDGSLVTLNTGSAISFSEDGRTVRLLKGEAVFKVAPDPRHPFSVEAGNGSSTALGTRFIVRQVGDGTRVTVTEHNVRVALFRQSILLREGDQVDYAKSMGLAQRVLAADADAWTRGRIRVVNRPLGEVVAELSRYHRGTIRVIGEDVARRPVSGTFDVEDPVGAIEVIRRTLDIQSTSLTDRFIFLHS